MVNTQIDVDTIACQRIVIIMTISRISLDSLIRISIMRGMLLLVETEALIEIHLIIMQVFKRIIAQVLVDYKDSGQKYPNTGISILHMIIITNILIILTIETSPINSHHIEDLGIAQLMILLMMSGGVIRL